MTLAPGSSRGCAGTGQEYVSRREIVTQSAIGVWPAYRSGGGGSTNFQVERRPAHRQTPVPANRRCFFHWRIVALDLVGIELVEEGDVAKICAVIAVEPGETMRRARVEETQCAMQPVRCRGSSNASDRSCSGSGAIMMSVNPARQGVRGVCRAGGPGPFWAIKPAVCS